jgi:signal transduction histidine kinase
MLENPHGMNRSPQEPVSGKGPASLAVWMAASVMLFTLLGSLALIWAFERRIEREERRAFEELARVNTSFLERSRLPQTAKMAEHLGEIIGAQVFFWQTGTGEVIGKKDDHLPDPAFKMRFDGGVKTISRGQWMVGLPGPNDTKVIFVRSAGVGMHAMSSSDTWVALAFFWLLSLALGWGMARRVTGPLRDMAKSLPLVGTELALPELPVARRDEIGQLAQTLTRTHQSLRDERELRRAAERHALLGRMAASLAHEVRNPVAAIRLHAQLLEHAGADEAAVSRDLIESEAGRIEELVSQWLNHARPVPPVLTEVDVVQSLRQAVQLMEPQARHAGVRIDMVAETSLLIPADRHRIQQVFGNLLRNAVQAMPSGGVITTRVLDEGKHVAVLFEDEGLGFSATALVRSGEPFFSEKEGGMGLGLAVAKDICLAHGGGLFVENRAGGGAVVRVEFSKNPPTNPVTPALQ